MGKVKIKIIAGMEFKSVSDEKYRVYEFADMQVRIDKPLWLNYNVKSGGHRVFDSNKICHYIPAGWKHLYWDSSDKNSDGFAF